MANTWPEKQESGIVFVPLMSVSLNPYTVFVLGVGSLHVILVPQEVPRHRNKAPNSICPLSISMIEAHTKKCNFNNDTKTALYKTKSFDVI